MYKFDRHLMFDLMPTQEQNCVVMLGDSITHNFHWGEFLTNPCLLNRGINGDTIKGVQMRLSEVMRHKPLKVFLLVGINDFGLGHSLEKFSQHYRELLEKLRTYEGELFIQSLLPVAKVVDGEPDYGGLTPIAIQANEILKELSVEFNRTYIDLFSHFVDQSEQVIKKELTNDGLHLSMAGYQLWLQIIQSYLV